MANRRFEQTGYRPFRTEPFLADGLLPVERGGGELLDRVSSALFGLAARFNQDADRKAQSRNALAGEQDVLAGRPQATFMDDTPIGGNGTARGTRFAAPVNDAIRRAAAETGEDPQALATIAQIESGGNPLARNRKSSAGGLFQQTDGNARDYGVADRFDPYQSALGAAKFMRDNRKMLRKALGRNPTAGELYLAHQQGGQGAASLLANPNALATDIAGYDAVRDNGGAPGMTAGQFAHLWINKAENGYVLPSSPEQIVTAGKPDLDRVKADVKTRFGSLQQSFGAPIPVKSGFRDPVRNANAGGAKHSQHMSGSALDLDVKDMPQAERIRLIKTARASGFTGIGVYANSIHIDTGPDRAWGPDYHRGSLPAWAQEAVASPVSNAAPPATGPTVKLSGGKWRPSGQDTIAGRAYDEAGARTYLQLVDTEMRSTTSQLFDRYRDDPVMLEKALGDLKSDMLKKDIFPEIQADFETGYGRMAESWLGQARDNRAAKVKQQAEADFVQRTGDLETDQQRRLAAFDPKNPDTGDAIASSQAAIDAHFDDAVARGIMAPDDAERAKGKSRREAALGFYGKQAEALDAAGVDAMRAKMKTDFAAGGVPGLDGDGYATLDDGLAALADKKRGAEARLATEFRQRGDAFAARLAAGYEINQADLAAYQLEAGKTPKGRQQLEETFANISAARAIRDMTLAQASAHVAGLKNQYGGAPTDSQLRRLAFAQGLLDQKRTAIATDSVSYAEAHGLVPATPMLTEAKDAGDLAAIVKARAAAATDAAGQLGAPVRYLKAGEAKAVADAVRKDPATGIAVAGAIVAGAGDSAPALLAEFGDDAPMIAEAGAIIAFGGSARAAEDVILGYGKSADGKPLKGLKPEAQLENFKKVTGSALAYASKDGGRIIRAAAAIARKRITEQGLDPTSDEALAIHRQAIDEAAGGSTDRGVKYGGFTDFGTNWFGRDGIKVMVPPGMRADLFEDAMLSVTDADLATLAVKPKPGIGFFGSSRGGAVRAAKSLARTLKDARPVAVPGGYAFAMGDPGSADPQWIEGDDGGPFVLDLMAMRDRLAPRVPGAFK